MAYLVGKLNWEEMQKSSLVESRKWEDLNVDILQKIFNGVPFSDLCNNIPLVCHTWRLGCLETVLPLDFPRGVDESVRLMRLLKTVMEGKDGYGCSMEQWRSSVQMIDIPKDVEISDKDLLYIAERTVGIKKLILWNCSRITGEGFANAVYNWKNVKFLLLEKVKLQNVTQFIDEINRNYSPFGWLLALNRESRLGHDDVRGIVKHLSNEVKSMSINRCSTSKDGFVMSLSSWSCQGNSHVSRDDDPSKIPDSLPSSFLLDITLTLIGKK